MNLDNPKKSTNRREFVKNSSLLAGGILPRQFFQKPTFFQAPMM